MTWSFPACRTPLVRMGQWLDRSLAAQLSRGMRLIAAGTPIADARVTNRLEHGEDVRIDTVYTDDSCQWALTYRGVSADPDPG